VVGGMFASKQPRPSPGLGTGDVDGLQRLWCVASEQANQPGARLMPPDRDGAPTLSCEP